MTASDQNAALINTLHDNGLLTNNQLSTMSQDDLIAWITFTFTADYISGIVASINPNQD